MALQADGFDRSVPLPPELKITHIREAIEHVEGRAAELIDICLEQANVFSGIVGIFGVQALHALSPYKKHKHPDIAQQRFPDLSLRGKLNPPPQHALESKGSTRPWALQSHYNHPGWYIVWRYAVDQTKRLKLDKMVAIWRVDIAFLHEELILLFSTKRTGNTRAAKRLKAVVVAPYFRNQASREASEELYRLPESQSCDSAGWPGPSKFGRVSFAALPTSPLSSCPARLVHTWFIVPNAELRLPPSPSPTLRPYRVASTRPWRPVHQPASPAAGT